MVFFFFFQAEDGIRDLYVTGVQTCALPIFAAVEDARGDVASERVGTEDVPASGVPPLRPDRNAARLDRELSVGPYRDAARRHDVDLLAVDGDRSADVRVVDALVRDVGGVHRREQAAGDDQDEDEQEAEADPVPAQAPPGEEPRALPLNPPAALLGCELGRGVEGEVLSGLAGRHLPLPLGTGPGRRGSTAPPGRVGYFRPNGEKSPATSVVTSQPRPIRPARQSVSAPF